MVFNLSLIFLQIVYFIDFRSTQKAYTCQVSAWIVKIYDKFPGVFREPLKTFPGELLCQHKKVKQFDQRRAESLRMLWHLIFPFLSSCPARTKPVINILMPQCKDKTFSCGFPIQLPASYTRKTTAPKISSRPDVVWQFLHKTWPKKLINKLDIAESRWGRGTDCFLILWHFPILLPSQLLPQARYSRYRTALLTVCPKSFKSI